MDTDNISYKRCFTYILRGFAGIFIITGKLIYTDVKRHKSLVTGVLLVVSIGGNILQMVYNKPRNDAQNEEYMKLKDSINNKAQSIYDIGYTDGTSFTYKPSKVMHK